MQWLFVKELLKFTATCKAYHELMNEQFISKVIKSNFDRKGTGWYTYREYHWVTTKPMIPLKIASEREIWELERLGFEKRGDNLLFCNKEFLEETMDEYLFDIGDLEKPELVIICSEDYLYEGGMSNFDVDHFMTLFPPCFIHDNKFSSKKHERSIALPTKRFVSIYNFYIK